MHIFLEFAITSITSSVKSLGCGDINLILSIPSIFSTSARSVAKFVTFGNSSSISSTLYELKFLIVHDFSDRYSGHYYSYCKIKGEWYVFNDCDYGDASQENPPLTEFSENVFPISFYFVKSK